MQNLGGVSQYQNQTITNNQEVTASTESVHQTNAFKQLVAGSVFEGVVTEVKDGQVTIGLNRGQALNAQLEQGVNLRPGEPMMFEVKSNNGTQISIRPVELMSVQNPTLSNALKTAGLPVTERNIALVNTMMKQQMSIDKSSLQQMARTVSIYRQADIETLVQMKKLDFAINEDSIKQFDNYKNNSHSLLEQFNGIMDSLLKLPEEVGQDAGKLLDFQKQLLDVFQEKSFISEKNGMVASGDINQQQGAKVNQQAASPAINQQPALSAENQQAISSATDQQAASSATNQQAVPAAIDQQIALTDRNQFPLASALNPKQQEALELQLRQLPGMEENPVIFQDGKLNWGSTSYEMLRVIQDTLQKGGGYPKEILQKLFSGKEYKNLMKQVMEQQWLVEPEEVASKENMEKLYGRVKQQMERLELLLQNTGKETAANKNVSSVRSNLEFMNQVNQLYSYIQMPLKLYNQNAHSDLYVYTNKKKLQDKEGELSALLHLDMEHLGPSDIHIKMLKNTVTTNFYLSDGLSVNLIRDHVGELQKKLEEKGYQCSIYFENRQKDVDFVEDFLEKEKPLGKVKRYSFDVLT